jgi:hypothetical protein
MGLKAPPARSTLADALNLRDWRMYHALAQRLIAHARVLYAQEPSVLDLDTTVYALDATTIDLCLSLFEWAPFRSTKAAIKLHTLLDLRGAIPAFIHISDGKLHDVNVLDILPIEAGAFYVMDRGYLDFARLYAMHQAGAFFVTRAKVRHPDLGPRRGPMSGNWVGTFDPEASSAWCRVGAGPFTASLPCSNSRSFPAFLLAPNESVSH